ncbi:MAG: stage II sporulation protein M [Clostridium sp.]|nr:stage II sporulation protein M [Clostridium sp.]
MKEDKFIEKNSKVWKDLESMLFKLKSKSIYKLDKKSLDEFINMYNAACSHLSYSRTYYGNTATTSYLNRLVASAHSYIYTTKKSNIKNLIRFLTVEFPLIIKANMKAFIISSGLFLVAVLASFVFTLISTDNAVAFVSEEYIQHVLESDVNAPRDSWDPAVYSNFILTNNIKVGILAFAFGVSFGLGTCYILIQNGFLLGALAALYNIKNADFLFWSLILPHGILELFAIFVCGAAGIKMGYSLVNPGQYSRKDSFILRSKTALKMVLGTIPIFIIAGFIEGYITPLPISGIIKYIFALLTLVLLILYIAIPNMKHNQSDLDIYKL